MTEGRELAKTLAAVTNALERQATAAEKLLELAEREEMVQVESGPPVCPGCGKLNPIVSQVQAGGDGPLHEFVMKVETHCCNKTMYAFAETWVMAPNLAYFESYIEQRRGGRNDN